MAHEQQNVIEIDLSADRLLPLVRRDDVGETLRIELRRRLTARRRAHARIVVGRHQRHLRPVDLRPDVTHLLRIDVRGIGDPSDRPLHVLARPKEGRHPTKRVRFHQIAVPLPRGAFLEIAPGIALCSPELVFVQMAESLSAGELIALGYELCGCYPLDAGRSSALVRTQLATPGRLAAFAKRAERIKGRRKRAPSFLSFARNQHR